MAGFLFRKQKQDLNNKSSVVISSPTTLQSPPTTPLYSRFSASSPRDAIGSTTPVRKVSVPKPLGQSRGQRGNGVEGKYGYSSNSLTSVDRDGQRKNTKVQDVAQRSQVSGEHSLERPMPQLLVDKPLPPPVPPDEDKPTTTATTRPRSTAFPQRMQGRMSLGPDKPLPRPGSSQSSLPIPPSKNSFSRTRLSSTSSSSVMQSADIQTKIQRQRLTSTSNQKIFYDPNHSESMTMKTEDSPLKMPIPSISSTSSDSISSTQRTSRKGSSESVKDQPEPLSSHNFNEIKHVPSQSSSFNSRRLPLDRGSSASGKSLDQHAFVVTPSVREGGGDMTLLQPGSLVKPSTSRRGLPSPPSPPSPPLASNASSLSRASVISAYHELYPAHVIMNNEKRYSVLGTEQQRPPLHRSQTAAQPLPSSSQFTNIPRTSLQISERQPLHVFRNNNQQHLYPEHHQPPLTSPHSDPVTLIKSPSLLSNVSSPPRGKPRIFAAMEAQENNQPRPSLYASHLSFSPPESQQDNRPLSFTSQSVDEDYSTPKLQIEFLPEINSNGDVDSPTTIKAFNPHNDAPGLEPHAVQQSHSKKSSGSRSVRQYDSRSQNTPHTPRTKKLSKVRQPADGSAHGHTSNGSTSTLPGSLDGGQLKKHHKSKIRPTVTSEPEPTVQLDEETIRNAGMPLDDDPFARVEGVKMLKPTSGARHKSSKENSLSSLGSDLDALKETLDQSQQKDMSESRPTTREHRQKKKSKKEKPPVFLFDPMLKKEPPEPATMPRLLLDPQILTCLLQYLSFFEWCILLSLSKEIRSALVRNSALRETALERFLKTIGYLRWTWPDEPLSLSLQDLFDYMRGVSTPTYEYSRIAAIYIHSLKMPTTHRDPSIRQVVQRFVASTRAYNRVLLRLRAQVEKEATLQPSAQSQAQSPISRAVNSRLSPTTRGGNSSRPSSRAPSPTASHTSINHSMSDGRFPGSFPQANTSQTNLAFHSPLFKLRRAPLLRVFVPSPEGDWLSDKSVLECEAECKRAGVQHLLRLGDVVWDVAVGDEGNVGRLVWDGNFLVDLDFTYSVIGDLPKYLHALAFSPSYFHRVIRTGHTNSNPIVHIDITPWGQEIMANLQLTQDRVRTETSQGAYHNLMRWVNRSSFQLRPVRGQQPGVVNRIAIPKTDSLFVDPGWYGTIVVETEGTNEAVADMRDRCGLGAISHQRPPNQVQIENRKVFRIVRERSRPGEIWIRAVSMKERLL